MFDAGKRADSLTRCETRLRNRIRWLMGGRANRALHDSVDIVQEVLLRVLEHLDTMTWQSDDECLRLCSRIARNLISNHRRRGRLERFETFVSQIAGATDTPSELAVADENVERMLNALERLDDDHRRVIEMRDFEQESFAAIGSAFGRTENAAQLLHSRALTRLGQLLLADRRNGPA